VHVYRTKGRCSRFLDNKTFPRIHDFYSIEEWREALETAYTLIKAHSDKLQTISVRINYGSASVKHEVNFYQNFVNDFEQLILFAVLASHYDCERVLIDYPLLRYTRKNHPELLTGLKARVLSNNVSNYLEIFSAQFINFLKIIYKTLRSKKKNTAECKKYKYISSGISPSEHPTKEENLNFSWMVENKLIDARDILYLLNADADETSSTFLRKEHINYTNKKELLTFLPIKDRLLLIFGLLPSIFISFFSLSYKQAFIFNATLEGRCWFFLSKYLKPEFYLFSISAGWPEPYETPILNHLGIKTINWLYSSAEFGYLKEDHAFTDLNIRFSFQESKEIWVWNSLTKQLFEKRSINSYGNKIKVIGPMMNGSWKQLKNKQSDHSRPFTITIFDMSPMKTDVRLQFGAGPFCPPEMVEEFYIGIRKLIEVYPTIYVEIKSKRGTDPKYYSRLETLEFLQQSNNSRVKFFASSVTPYVAIKESDLIISIPYSSPTLLGLSLGIPAFFYDPTNIAVSTFNKAFESGLTIHNIDDLIKLVDKAMKKELKMENYYTTEHIDRISLEEMETRIKNNLK
jgi:polysaccharide biosynthesis PFTS motif protein